MSIVPNFTTVIRQGSHLFRQQDDGSVNAVEGFFLARYDQQGSLQLSTQKVQENNLPYATDQFGIKVENGQVKEIYFLKDTPLREVSKIRESINHELPEGIKLKQYDYAKRGIKVSGVSERNFEKRLKREEKHYVKELQRNAVAYGVPVFGDQRHIDKSKIDFENVAAEGFVARFKTEGDQLAAAKAITAIALEENPERRTKLAEMFVKGGATGQLGCFQTLEEYNARYKDVHHSRVPDYPYNDVMPLRHYVEVMAKAPDLATRQQYLQGLHDGIGRKSPEMLKGMGGTLMMPALKGVSVEAAAPRDAERPADILDETQAARVVERGASQGHDDLKQSR